MRILHVDTGRELRGGQHQLLLLLRGLAAQGHEQTLLARRPLLDHWAGREVTAGALARAARQADLIHAHDARGHALAAVFGGVKPLVVSRRVAFPVGRGWLSRWKYARARRYIAVSEFVRQELLRAGVPETRIEVIYDGTPLSEEEGSPGREREGSHVTASGPVVAPGVSDPLKGAALVRAACDSIGVAVKLSSALPADLLGARVFVYLSESEGLGSAILLAMARHVPVVASRLGGIPEIVEHEVTGLLVENSVEQVAAAIRRFLEDGELARGCAARAYQRVRERFSDAIMVRRTEQVYRAVVGSVPLP